MHKLMALAPLTLCLATALSGCDKQRVVTNLAPPNDKLVCAAAGPRPNIPAEYVIDWGRVATVAQARVEHDKYVAVIRTREGRISGYILSLEGKLFVCGSNMQWLRDYYGSMPHG